MTRAVPRLPRDALALDERPSTHPIPSALDVRRDARVQVWLLRLDELDRTTWGPHARTCLSAEEQQRADRMRKLEARRRWVTCHAAMRHILAGHTGSQMRDLLFMRGPNGKPFVPDGPHFNLSHSAGMALLAVSAGGSVGIDLEIEGHGRNLAAAATLTLAPAELSCFEAAAPEEQARLLRRAWVRKEAVLKAAGCGLRADLRSLTVGLDADVRRRIRFAENDYHIEDLALPFPAAIAGAMRFVVTMSEFAADARPCPG